MSEYNIGFGRPSPSERQLPIFVERAGFNHLHTIVDRPNGFPVYQWLQSHTGSGILEIYGKQHIISENTGIFMPKNIKHKYYSTSEIWTLDWTELDGTCIDDIKTQLGIPDFGIFYNINTASIRKKITEIVQIYNIKPPAKIMKAASCAYQIMTDIAIEIHETKRSLSRLTPVTDYINQHYDKPLTLETLASLINVTPNHLCYLFKKELKMRPMEYINSIRINNARYLLREDTSMTISKVAALCGFINDNHFREVFRKFCSMSPSQYRNI